MNNKNLETIQKVFGVFKILSQVFMILCFVAAGITLVSSIMVLAGSNVPIAKVGGVSIYLPVFFDTKDLAFGTEKIGWLMLVGFVTSLCEGILFAHANHYFTVEQKEGTPFTENGAKLTLRLGITAIILSVVCSAVQGIIYENLKYSELVEEFSNTWGITLGVAMILFSLIIRYGADLVIKDDKKDTLE